MNTIITYDIVNDKQRTRLRKFLKDLGIRSQYSVFECRIDLAELKLIRHFCRDNLDLEKDSVRIYRVCKNCMNGAEIQGKGVKFSQLDWVII